MMCYVSEIGDFVSKKKSRKQKLKGTLQGIKIWSILLKKKGFDIGNGIHLILKIYNNTAQLKCTFFYKTFRGEAASTRLTHHRPLPRLLRVLPSTQPDNGGMFSGS